MAWLYTGDPYIDIRVYERVYSTHMCKAVIPNQDPCEPYGEKFEALGEESERKLDKFNIKCPHIAAEVCTNYSVESSTSEMGTGLNQGSH